MASILEGFLVRLGFEVDQDGMQKFNASVSAVATRVANVGKAAAATGVALGAAFIKANRCCIEIECWEVLASCCTNLTSPLCVKDTIDGCVFGIKCTKTLLFILIFAEFVSACDCIDSRTILWSNIIWIVESYEFLHNKIRCN